MYLAGVSAIVLGTPAAAAAQTQQSPINAPTPAANPATDAASVPSSASALSATIAVAGQAAAQTASGDIAEVVVTASRREESLREVPTAVSAYSSEKIRDSRFASLTDLVVTSPSVEISTWQPNANVAIRGIGNSQISAGADAGVAVHADGVYLGQPGLALTSFLDVARVEILRGPQGTLFGRNATGGAINIIPNLPTGDLHYGVDVTAGFSPTLLRGSAYISGPLNPSGTLLGRVAMQQDFNEGFTRNIISTIQGKGGTSNAEPRRLDGIQSASIRAQLQWAPGDTFSTRLSVEHSRRQDNGPGAFVLGAPDPSIPLPVYVQGLPFGDPSKRETYANLGDRDLKASTVNLITDIALGGGNLRATLSYQDSDNRTLQDGDGTSFDFTHTGYRYVADQRYAELLYTSDPSVAFTYVIGGNFFYEDLAQEISVPIAGFPMPVNLGGTIKTTSYAVFARWQYEFDMGLKIFAGARYSHDKKNLDEYNNYLGLNQERDSWSRFTYEFGASYDFSDRVTGYAKYATGYKGGGYSAGAIAGAVDPETNVNIEIGLKGTYLNGGLQANLSAFHMKYDDLQVNQIIGASSTLSNAAKATVKGIEAEFVARPVRQIRLELSGAWLDASFDEFLTNDSSRPSLGQLDLAGNRLPGAPRFSASTGAYFDTPIASGTVTFGARYDWKSRLYFSEFNIPISSQEAVGRLNLSVNYKSDDGRWTAGIFAQNVTDKQVRSNVLVVSALLGSLAVAQYQPGRQVGASLGYRF